MKTKKIRYAAVGLGYISQIALLPSFKHAGKNSRLTALVSGDADKLKKLGKKYKVENLYSYEEFNECLSSGEIDAVYIATPNTLHADLAIRALEKGIHVLCEKPLAADEESCTKIIQASRKSGAKLMVAYRLHFESANLYAIQLANSGKIGELKVFNSLFSFPIDDADNIRLKPELGGGPLYDIGIYCINAARYLFRSEPLEVFAMGSQSSEPRFRKILDTVSATMRFPNGQLASFSVSFNGHDSSVYDLLGTKGKIRLDSAYDYATPMELEWKVGEKTHRRQYPKRDQFAAELLYFSDCIRKNKDPEPSGLEGLADVRIIRALLKSMDTGKPVAIHPVGISKRPTMKQKITRPGIVAPKLIQAQQPSA